MNTEGKFLYGDREKRYWDRVAVFGPTYGPDIYANSPAGLIEALAAALSGHAVVLPLGAIAGDFTVPDGVRLIGRDPGSIITGTVTLGIESAAEHLWVVIDTDDTVDYNGLVVDAPTAVAGDLCYVRDCHIYVIQTGASGKANALYAQHDIDVQIWDSDLYGYSANEQGYAIKKRALQQGNVYVWGGRCRGSTMPFLNGAP